MKRLGKAAGLLRGVGLVAMAKPSCVWCDADVTTQNAKESDAASGRPDGIVTGADLQYFVNAWVGGDPINADITTQNAGEGDPGFGVPDGIITGADIQFYVNLWIAGCP